MTPGSKFDDRMELAIAALLTQPTHAEAARTAGVSEATLQRWLRQPDFVTEYRAARRAVVEGAIAKVQAIAGEAVAALRRNLTCGSPSVQVRAALGILDIAAKGVELTDLAERV